MFVLGAFPDRRLRRVRGLRRLDPLFVGSFHLTVMFDSVPGPTALKFLLAALFLLISTGTVYHQGLSHSPIFSQSHSGSSDVLLFWCGRSSILHCGRGSQEAYGHYELEWQAPNGSPLRLARVGISAF